MPELDTLVFYLCEYVSDSPRKKDLQLYVLYDFEREAYAVYGSRQEATTNTNLLPKLRPFHFYLNHSRDVLDFIKSVVDSTSSFCFSLYALNGLPIFMTDINFNLLTNFRDRTHEIAGWEYTTYNEDVVKRMVPLVRQAYTYYEFEEDVLEEW